MIVVCPFCGNSMPEILVDGIASCIKCNRVFDSSLQNRLLSASWLVKKHNYGTVEQLISDTRLPEHEAIIAYSFVGENGYSVEEFLHVLKKLGI